VRVAGLDISRADTNGHVEAEVATKSIRREIGASGTIASDGYVVSSDYNTELTGKRGLNTWNRMRRSDGAIREALWHIFAPIINATWEVQPASEEPLDLEVAEFGRSCLHEWPVDPWAQTLRAALLYLPQGFQVFETVEQVIEAELTYTTPQGENVKVPSRQFVCWRRFAHRRPETIEKWNSSEGELRSIEQMVFDQGSISNPVIPAENLVVLTNEKEGDDWTGLSLLRSAYKAWTLKEMVEKVAGMAFERHGVGVPVGYLPERLSNDPEALTRLEEMLRDLRAGEYHYLAFNAPKASTNVGGRDGYTVEILTPSGGIPDFIPFLEYLRGEIKGNVLARFSELGHGSVGARATGDVQSEVWISALDATAKAVGDVFTDTLHRLIDKNYRVTRYPKIVPVGIEARSLTEYADATSKLVASGAAISDRPLRKAVRKFMGWPEEEEPEAIVEPVIEEEPEPEDGETDEDEDEEDAEAVLAAFPASANYREATGTNRCGLCDYFNAGTCELFNEPAGADMVCDSFEPEPEGEA
jgi:hypothetical protein